MGKELLPEERKIFIGADNEVVFRSDLPEVITVEDLIFAISIAGDYTKGLEGVFVRSIVDADRYPCDYFTAEYDWGNRTITLYVPLWHKKERVYRAWFGEAWTEEVLRKKLLEDALLHEIGHHVSLHIMGYKQDSPSADLKFAEEEYQVENKQGIFDKEEEERAEAIHYLLMAQAWTVLEDYIKENMRK
jgi:hypothetical protein